MVLPSLFSCDSAFPIPICAHIHIQVLNGATFDQTASEVQALILSWLGDASGLPAPTLLKAYASSASDASTRFSFKYACLRSVYGTPTFLINQLMVNDLSADSTVADWSKHLDPLLAGAAREGATAAVPPAAAVEVKGKAVEVGVQP